MKFSEKLLLSAGSAAAMVAPVAADAALVTVTGSPVSVSFLNGPLVLVADQAIWDIDGANGGDFALLGFATFAYGTTSVVSFRVGFNFLLPRSVNSGTMGILTVPLNGVSVAAATGFPIFGNALAAIPSSYRVSSLLANYGLSSAPAGASIAEVYRTFSTGGDVTNQSTGYFVQAGGGGTFNIAFSFLSGADTLFGWAEVNLSGSPDWTFTINEWTYGDEGEDVHVGTRAQVSEPASTLPALALLGLGAVGVRQWRKRKAEA
jgi:hypothetical protein